jgi:Cu2+-containing amine oxidase
MTDYVIDDNIFRSMITSSDRCYHRFTYKLFVTDSVMSDWEVVTDVSYNNMSLPYPFDPLSRKEQELALNTVKAVLPSYDAEFDEWDIINLNEPPKAEMRTWKAGTGPRPQRQAVVTIYMGQPSLYYEYIVNLYPDGTAEVVRTRLYKKARSPYSCLSDGIATTLLAGNSESDPPVPPDSRVVAAMVRRGITVEQLQHDVYWDVSPDSRLDDLRKCPEVLSAPTCLRLVPVLERW